MTLAEKAAAIDMLCEKQAFADALGLYPSADEARRGSNPAAFNQRRAHQTAAMRFVELHGDRLKSVADALPEKPSDRQLRIAARKYAKEQNVSFVWWLPLVIYGIQAIYYLIKWWKEKS